MLLESEGTVWLDTRPRIEKVLSWLLLVPSVLQTPPLLVNGPLLVLQVTRNLLAPGTGPQATLTLVASDATTLSPGTASGVSGSGEREKSGIKTGLE